MAGTRTGNVLQYTGNNLSVPDGVSIGSLCGATAATVFHRYVPRANTRLTIATPANGSGTLALTILVMTDACGAPIYGGTRSLACVAGTGSVFMTPVAPVARIDATAGTPVYIAAAGYDPYTTGGGIHGEYVLTVTEVPIVAVGATCDRALTTSACTTGSSCSPVDPPVCIADGALNGTCRSTYPACNSDSGATPTAPIVAPRPRRGRSVANTSSRGCARPTPRV